MNRFWTMAIVAVVPCLVWAEGTPLMPCPDCGREVSKRALMCPNCGLNGEIIEQAAKKLEEKIKPKEPDRWMIAAGWQAIQPMALKNHGKILLRIKAGEDAHLPPKALPYYRQLQSKWEQERKTK